eukprot:TRINITY_DN4330_c0_g1_i1.p1 TRINITY_DN4330_c0_g1~~TRINITY_DN4330_c0_g1_i1.p1  ORF type:complete len:428 (+),score=68.47 TRINITY_DN4330_c0_g1_i1:156-1286(+)
MGFRDGLGIHVVLFGLRMVTLTLLICGLLGSMSWYHIEIETNTLGETFYFFLFFFNFFFLPPVSLHLSASPHSFPASFVVWLFVWCPLPMGFRDGLGIHVVLFGLRMVTLTLLICGLLGSMSWYHIEIETNTLGTYDTFYSLKSVYYDCPGADRSWHCGKWVDYDKDDPALDGSFKEEMKKVYDVFVEAKTMIAFALFSVVLTVVLLIISYTRVRRRLIGGFVVMQVFVLLADLLSVAFVSAAIGHFGVALPGAFLHECENENGMSKSLCKEQRPYTRKFHDEGVRVGNDRFSFGPLEGFYVTGFGIGVSIVFFILSLFMTPPQNAVDDHSFEDVHWYADRERDGANADDDYGKKRLIFDDEEDGTKVYGTMDDGE